MYYVYINKNSIILNYFLCIETLSEFTQVLYFQILSSKNVVLTLISLQCYLILLEL